MIYLFYRVCLIEPCHLKVGGNAFQFFSNLTILLGQRMEHRKTKEIGIDELKANVAEFHLDIRRKMKFRSCFLQLFSLVLIQTTHMVKS